MLKGHARGRQTSFKFDVEHQLSRLRVSKKIAEVEVQAMYEVLVAHVQTHQEIIEVNTLSSFPLIYILTIPNQNKKLRYDTFFSPFFPLNVWKQILSHAPPYSGGLSPFGFGLHHTSEKIRNLTVEFIRKIESNPTGQKFFQSLNLFHKLGYQRLAHYIHYQQTRPGSLNVASHNSFSGMSFGDLSSSVSGFGGESVGLGSLLGGSGDVSGGGGGTGNVLGLNGFVVYDD